MLRAYSATEKKIISEEISIRQPTKIKRFFFLRPITRGTV